MTETPRRMTPAEAARAYLQRGWMPTKLDGKAAVWKDWPKRVVTEDEIAGLFGPKANVGILHGPISGHLVDVDLDCTEAVRAAPHLLPPTPMMHGRRGAGLSHYWYVCEGLKTARMKDPQSPAGAKGALVEALGEGTQSMVPPSVHPSGEDVLWCQNVKFEPTKVKPRELLIACQRLAAVALIARQWLTGARSELAMQCGGWWAKAGVPVEDAELWMRAICAAAGDEEASGRITSVRHSYQTHEAGEPVKGASGLEEALGADVLRQAGLWLGLRGQHGANRGQRGTGGQQKLRCGVNLYRFELMEELACTDAGNASRLLTRYGEDLLYCKAWQSWLLWDKDRGRWLRDETLMARLQATDVARRVAREEAAGAADDDKRATLLHWAQQSANAGRIDAMLQLAAASRQVAVTPEDLDRSGVLLNVANGTLNLSTDALLVDAAPLRPSARGDRLTKLAPVTFDAAAECPLWRLFLSQIFDGDEELIAFVQRLAGYCLIAGNPEQYVVIMHGSGANGKSTLLETLKAMLGDYAATVAPEVLMSRDSGSNNQLYALASLRGARLVTASETEDGRQLAESLIKTMTGSEAIMAREPYGAPFEFTPAFTPYLATNHKPQVRDTSEGMWRRVLLVPFSVTIPREDRDPRLPEKLQAELSGILNWCLEGLLDYYEREVEHGRGLMPPPAVCGATEAYRIEQDLLAAFLGECCELKPEQQQYKVTKGALYKEYERWCEENAEYCMQIGTFGRKMKARGVTESHSGGTRYWTGILCPAIPTCGPMLDLPGGGA